MAVKYITQADGKGWIKVKRDTTGAEVSLPHYLKVNYIKTDNGRDYFIPYVRIGF
jgi:hypothetical protein